MGQSVIEVSLLDFFRTGQFGPIQLGMTPHEIKKALGKPDVYYSESESHYMQAGIWWYGDIEFHFGEDPPRLFLIWCDHIPLRGRKSKRTHLDSWLFADGGQPNKEEMEHGLKAAGIPFKYCDLEEKLPGDMAIFSEGDERSSQFKESTGVFVMESGVEIAVGEIETHFRDNREPTVCESLVVTICHQNWDYFY